MSKRAIVLSIEGFSPASLQPYGCSWQSTPCLNQLAAQSLLFDRLFADSVQPSHSLESMWQGCHAAWNRDSARDRNTESVFGDWKTSLLTDDPEITNCEIAGCFADPMVIRYDESSIRSRGVEQTVLADLLSTWIERVAGEPDGLHWCHVTSLARYWDAPLYLFDGNDDLPTFDSTSPPRCDAADAVDPDERLSWMNAYGGQVRVLDSLLEVLIGVLDASVSWEDNLLIIAGTSGFALGENGCFGHDIGPATSSRIHLPLIVRTAGGESLRSSRICQPDDIGQTIRGWLQGERLGLLRDRTPDGWADVNTAQSWAVALAPHGQLASFLTPNWLLHRNQEASELYRKPDDRFDVNDIALRAPEIVRLLEEHSDRALDSLRAGTERHRLPEEIFSGDW